MISKQYFHKIVSSKIFKNLVRFVVIPGLMFTSIYAFADSAQEGNDLLAGTAKDLIKTVNNTGKTYLYIAELIIASVGFIKTRNPMMFLGILALSVGFNVLFKVAGLS